jgi:hypothetical protein
MHGTNRIYEEPSRLSLGLVVGLSIAVVVMAGWLAATIMLSQTTPVEGAADATAGAPDASTASLPTTLRQPASRSNPVFDWPAEFASSTPPAAAAPPAQAAPPLAPELAPTRDVGGAPWLAAPDVRDRSLASRRPAEATDAIVDILAPPAPPRPAAAAPTPRPTQAQRRPKPQPRVVETDAAVQ